MGRWGAGGAEGAEGAEGTEEEEYNFSDLSIPKQQTTNNKQQTTIHKYSFFC
ncbi:MAG: hypothetical protein F6J92_25685 [Symploca sp. SIO1A3]|nr:hypothetical protein [Symploca sp. SIO1A3]